MKKEIIICAAVKIKGRLFRGNRHGDCMVSARARFKNCFIARDDQGFITSSGRFVSREDAYKIHVKQGIPSANPNGYIEGTLFSEDLY